MLKIKDTEKYHWTWHVKEKMAYYRLSPSLVKKIISRPARIEEGIAPKTIAVMQPAKTKKYQEVWVMYQVGKTKKTPQIKNAFQKPKIKIITAWRYPGKSPERNPIPPEIFEEIKSLL